MLSNLKKIIKHSILRPLSLLYEAVMLMRNYLYDQQLLPSTSFENPVICVGNLAAGGTGKTPMTEFLLRKLSDDFSVAVLSRGYRRRSKGFILADANSTADLLGDEPYQLFRKFSNIRLAVDGQRVRGITKLLELPSPPQVIIMDDGFQHRAVTPGFSILLTDYSRLYTRDYVLPAGLLRESRSQSRRADIIVVTKCPAELTLVESQKLEAELHPQASQSVFFSSVSYGHPLAVFPGLEKHLPAFEQLQDGRAELLLVTGIASPKAIITYLTGLGIRLKSIIFADHHIFTKNDYQQIEDAFRGLSSTEKYIFTTEKDASRIASDRSFPQELKSHLFALPIRVEILFDKEILLTQKIRNYVDENSGNG